MTLTKMAENDGYDSIDDDENSAVSLKKQALSEDEDTDDASETDRAKQEEATEIKEQMYREKLALIRQQESQLESETMPEFARKQKKLEQIYRERQKQIQAYHAFLLNKIEKEFKKDQEAAFAEFERKKVDLKESLLTELQEKKKQIESEKHSLELTSPFISLVDVKAVTRKLRRRPNEPAPVPNEKRRKPSPTQLNFVLTDEEISDDLKMMNNGNVTKPPGDESSDTNITPNRHVECRVEQGKVFYDKRWYHTGQPVFLEYHKEGTRISGVLNAITEREIWIQKVADGSKVRVFASQLHRGKCSIKKRTT